MNDLILREYKKQKKNGKSEIVTKGFFFQLYELNKF